MSQIENISIMEEEISENKEPVDLGHQEDNSDPDQLNEIEQLEIPISSVEETIEKKEKKKKETAPNPYLENFLKELEQLPDADSRLQKTIEFMQTSLSQNGTPHFKSFWDARAICMQLFKENISPNLRTPLWNKYTELSSEARRLKEMLDEQSSFAAEQIEIAIKALEDDIANSNLSLEKMSPLNFGINSQILGNRINDFQKIQQELNLLNTQASRINALRKELVKTEMRVRQKNKFFQRLSLAGDQVFPRRKELIKEVSSQFSQDVENFIQSNFSENNIEDSLFFLREEIKALQAIAKLLTLNTHSFTHTRLCLSECWDKIKGVEKERKKVRAQQKVTFKQSQDLVMEKINALKLSFETQALSNQEAQKQIDEIISFMRSVELGREELKFLREQLSEARKPLNDKIKAEEQEKLNKDQEREDAKRKKMSDLKEEIESFSKNLDHLDIDKIIENRDALSEKITNAGLNKTEKHEIERVLKPLRNTIADLISEKKEQALMSLSEDDRMAIQQLKEILEQRKERRQEIKLQLENFRRASGGSGLDFEQAMAYRNQIQEEKERLEKINLGIKEIETKLSEMQRKL